MLARRFLWTIAIVIIAVIGAAFAYSLFGSDLVRLATVPKVPFRGSPVSAPANYRQLSGWLAHPRLAGAARWTPPGQRAVDEPRAAVFFVPGAAYIGNDRWTMPLSDAVTDARAAAFVKAEASVFNGVGEVWAPRYRSASFGATQTASADAEAALDFAYGDVLRAFDAFVGQVSPSLPIILAGQGEGSRQLLRLLRDRVAGTRLQPRIVAAYAIGWPVSVAADLPATGLPACGSAAQARCLVSWLAYADPADPAALRRLFDATPSLTGRPHKGTAILCSNPLTGGVGGAAPASVNIGARVSDTQTLVAHGIAARCLTSGVLSIGPPPARFGQYVLPGNDYQFYDYPLFWANLRADAAGRLAAFK